MDCSKYIVKISDFGLATSSDYYYEPNSKTRGPLRWSPPEVYLFINPPTSFVIWDWKKQTTKLGHSKAKIFSQEWCVEFGSDILGNFGRWNISLLWIARPGGDWQSAWRISSAPTQIVSWHSLSIAPSNVTTYNLFSQDFNEVFVRWTKDHHVRPDFQEIHRQLVEIMQQLP